MFRAALIHILFLAMLLPATAFAADAPYSPRAEALAEINRIDPLQNPRYDTKEEILGRRVLDRKTKVVGEVRDVILNENGNIDFLDVEFDRLGFGTTVPVNYGALKIEPVTNGYGMTFDSKEIAGLYPTLLANIDTAAGNENSYALSKIPGMEIWNVSGRRVGTVRDVLFAANGARAEAFYVTLENNTSRGVAIPFGSVDFTQAASQRHLLIPDEMGDAMVTVAQRK